MVIITKVFVINEHGYIYDSFLECSAQVFKIGRVPSENGTFSAVNGPSKGTISVVNWRKRALITAVNGRKRALLTRWMDNKRDTAQSTLCVDNKKDKTAKPCVWLTFKKNLIKKASFQLFKNGRASPKMGRDAMPCKNGLGRTQLLLLRGYLLICKKIATYVI